MPAGLPYFAWVDADEDTFEPAHMRWDESVFSFNIEQSEGDPANMTLVIRRPRNEAGDAIGLLSPGRKIWAWFALDCGSALFKFRGRLVGVPTSIFEELVTLEFVARPNDVVEQKEALAETLRVLPHYDEVVLDPARRTDPEVVLEGYTKIWHYDRETHILTVSDEIVGEDGLVEFDGASEDRTVLYDGLALTLTGGPLSRVDVNAQFTWTQQGGGSVDLTKYITERWPNEFRAPGLITSFTLKADSWPKVGAGIGSGWTVAAGSVAYDVFTLQVNTIQEGGKTTVQWSDGATTVVEARDSTASINAPPGSIIFKRLILKDDWKFTYSDDDEGLSYASSYNRQTQISNAIVPLYHVIPRLFVGYQAGRDVTEQVSFSLIADVQHILTSPEDGEALRIDDIRSVNLSETIGEGESAYVPMVDSRRRSYIATERGNRSLEHLIALARAHLMKRARVVEITFAPRLSRMPEITLRKDAFLLEPRVGEALGKIIGYSLALDGSDGRINCTVRIGCAIGRGGSAVATEGSPTYASTDYVDADYQQFIDRFVLLDTSVGYEPPLADPNDDGINFLSHLTAADVIAQGLTLENPPAMQRLHIEAVADILGKDRGQIISEMMRQIPTKARFRLKNMLGAFASDYQIQVTDLKIPTGYDLEAV